MNHVLWTIEKFFISWLGNFVLQHSIIHSNLINLVIKIIKKWIRFYAIFENWLFFFQKLYAIFRYKRSHLISSFRPISRKMVLHPLHVMNIQMWNIPIIKKWIRFYAIFENWSFFVQKLYENLRFLLKTEFHFRTTYCVQCFMTNKKFFLWKISFIIFLSFLRST